MTSDLFPPDVERRDTGDRAWTVASLLLAAGDALAARFGAVTVRGELSGYTRAASGHCYFTLKDADGAAAVLRCALFRRAASLLAFPPADGQQVELRGRLAVFEPRGELQMVVESLRRVGTGALYEEFLRRRARLAADGVFDAASKRPVAAHPCRIGVVTSLGAAALHDVLTALARRAPHVAVVVYPSAVQGADAPRCLVDALQLAGRRAEVDTLLLVRGGGALEDLWAFNDEAVARAVRACLIPVVCGVGHETDVTLADLAADLRAPTPTAAAELAAPAREDVARRLDGAAAALARSVDRRLQSGAQRLDTLASRLGAPARGLSAQRQRLAGTERALRQALAGANDRHGRALRRAAERLQRVIAVDVQRATLRLDGAAQRLAALDPARVLQRGYAWVEGTDGRPVVSVRALAAGDAVRAVWADGTAAARIERVESLPPRPDRPAA